MALVISEELTIDCDSLGCLPFKDITKEYNAITNPNGYGGPNSLGISHITSVNFVINLDGDDYTFEAPPYLPNALGTSEICLKGSDFYGGIDLGYLVFVPGTTYTLLYFVNFDDDTTREADGNEFLFPCCGSAITSNLATNYSLTEKIGCSSVDFKDTTGTYNADDNPGGYGAPNPGYGDITSTLIKVTLGNGTVVNITDFIPTADNQIKNITAAVLGYGDGVIPPQVMTIEYSVYTTGICRIGYKTSKVLFHCVLRNCLVSKGKSIVVQACNSTCNKADQKIVISLIHRYEMLLLASYSNIDCIAGEVEDLYEECKKYCGCP